MKYIEARRLAAELRNIVLNPETHNQENWAMATSDPRKNSDRTACGTTGCLAGNAVINAGYKPDWRKDEVYDYSTNTFSNQWYASTCIMPNGTSVYIRDTAMDLFGLSSGEARELFEASNSVRRLWELAIRYSDGFITIADVIEAYTARVQKVQDDFKATLVTALESL